MFESLCDKAVELGALEAKLIDTGQVVFRSSVVIGLAIEKEAMLLHGCLFAFSMFLCVRYEECAYPEPCLYPQVARPAMDAYGIDIGKTLEPLGFKVEFDREGGLFPAWYGRWCYWISVSSAA